MIVKEILHAAGERSFGNLVNYSSRSSFGTLVKYLSDEQSNEHRVGAIRTTNLISENDLTAAIIECEAVMARNHRATGSRVSHLIISFREGESLSDEVMHDIEDELCKALGYEEHQRISVVHRDTENLHIHLSINRVHPVTFKLHSPWQSHTIMATVCREMELKHGLEVDNHLSRQSPNKAIDAERQLDIAELTGFIQRKHLEKLREAESWREIHTVLAADGITLKKRANGLVFSVGDIHVKASSIARDLSKQSLETRLGRFEEPQLAATNTHEPNIAAKRTPRQQAYSNEAEKALNNYQTLSSVMTLLGDDGTARSILRWSLRGELDEIKRKREAEREKENNHDRGLSR